MGNRMKTERDNFEHLLTDWKNINKDASEALYNLQREKQRVEEENMSLTEQIKEYQLEINSLKLQNNERGEQCDHLLSRCNQYQNDIKNLKSKMRSKQHQNNAMNPNNINTLKFNYQQKKNEIDQILYQIQKLFFFAMQTIHKSQKHRIPIYMKSIHCMISRNMMMTTMKDTMTTINSNKNTANTTKQSQRKIKSIAQRRAYLLSISSLFEKGGLWIIYIIIHRNRHRNQLRIKTKRTRKQQ